MTSASVRKDGSVLIDRQTEGNIIRLGPSKHPVESQGSWLETSTLRTSWASSWARPSILSTDHYPTAEFSASCSHHRHFLYHWLNDNNLCWKWLTFSLFSRTQISLLDFSLFTLCNNKAQGGMRHALSQGVLEDTRNKPALGFGGVGGNRLPELATQKLKQHMTVYTYNALAAFSFLLF